MTGVIQEPVRPGNDQAVHPARHAWLRARGPRAAALAWLQCALACSAACTEPVERAQVSILIDADSAVRAMVSQVIVVVEAQDAQDTGLQVEDSRRLVPDPEHPWPFTYRLDPEPLARGRQYQLTATARNTRGAVVAQASLIREVERARNLELRVHFETACLRRIELCTEGFTCRDGDCVSAKYDPNAAPSVPTAPGGPAAGGPDAGESPIDSGPEGIANEAEACTTDAARSCAGGHASSVPLRCDGSVWRAQPPCPENQRCDTTEGDNRGLCQPIAQECMGREAGVEFCDAEEKMRVCVDLVSSALSTCGEHERCVTDPDLGALCKCRLGFVQGPTGCSEATDCDAYGSCDGLTRCSIKGAARVCSACPAGYGGSGETGCRPLLAELRPSAGELSPAFTPDLHDYRLRLPLLVQRVSLAAIAPQGASIEVNGLALDAPGEWTSPELALGETAVNVVVSSAFDVHNSYRIVIERSGVQEAQIKAKAPSENDAFGESIALSGDTLVVGAPYEDSAATGVDGDPSSEAASESGAAYVFVRKAGSWSQQAYLKANDSAAGAFFGTTVAIDRDTIVVGALHDDKFDLASVPTRSGAVYVFERKGERWSQTARLQPGSSAIGDLFGYSLAIEQDTLIAGAAGASTSVSRSGVVHVFRREADGWNEQAALQARTPIRNSLFGASMVLAGDLLAVSSLEQSGGLDRAGAAYVFVRGADGWREQQRIQADEPGDAAYFGYSMALSADMLIVGAPNPDLIRITPRGQVYVFDRSGDRWTQSAVLTAIQPRPSDYFGAGVALRGATLLVGANGDPSGSRGIPGDPARTDAPYAGAAYLFARTPDGWAPSAFLKADNTDHDQGQGWSVALSEDSAIVGAVFESSGAGGINPAPTTSTLRSSGAVYVFR